MYLGDICTVAANLAGLPALSLPVGVDPQGLPVGMQLMATRFGEETLFKTAHALERTLRFHDRHRPKLA
jgi:aspartyl-tRNA(Asn)/glutamyl-tRNA(Gln) amidotransferase subunit A